jgi:hypothetical protein
MKADLLRNAGAGLVEDLNRYLDKAKNIKNVQLSSARKHLVFNDKSYSLYTQQGQVLGAGIGALRDNAAAIAQSARKISAEAAAIRPEDAAMKKDEICRQFSDLSGAVLPACEGTAAPEAGKSVLDAVMSLRGVKGVVDNALDDKETVAAETAAWEAASPKLKLDGDKIDKQLESMEPPQANIAACLLRSDNELPPDAAVLKGNPETSVAAHARGASASILEYRKALKLGVPAASQASPVTAGNSAAEKKPL